MPASVWPFIPNWRPAVRPTRPGPITACLLEELAQKTTDGQGHLVPSLRGTGTEPPLVPSLPVRSLAAGPGSPGRRVCTLGLRVGRQPPGQAACRMAGPARHLTRDVPGCGEPTRCPGRTRDTVWRGRDRLLGGCRLTLFPAGSAGEDWRLFRPANGDEEAPHFVVVGGRVANSE